MPGYRIFESQPAGMLGPARVSRMLWGPVSYRSSTSSTPAVRRSLRDQVSSTVLACQLLPSLNVPRTVHAQSHAICFGMSVLNLEALLEGVCAYVYNIYIYTYIYMYMPMWLSHAITVHLSCLQSAPQWPAPGFVRLWAKTTGKRRCAPRAIIYRREVASSSVTVQQYCPTFIRSSHTSRRHGFSTRAHFLASL